MKKAKEEFKSLDGSSKILVEKAFRKLEYRADEIGKVLGNTSYANLSGCKEVKLKRIGLRMIFRIIGEQVQVVQIISINKRDDEKVFRIASQRINK